ncbi:MAG: ComEC/Rec2 family competence protein, partial [Lachnospiraceae bacterium]|nr:ComEC/Rec2 family competence protein [Lachnospiraceae bacterium]
ASQSSFLLSFGAILSMAILLPRLQEANPFRTAFPDGGERRQNITRKARKHGGNIIKNIACSAWDLLCGGAGVWLGTLPITLWFFYQTVPWSLLVNLAVVPLMSALMAFGMISCLVGLFSVSAGTFLAAPVYYLLGLFEGLCSLEQKLPCPVWIVGRPELWKIVVYYVLLMAAACSVRILRNFSGNLCVVGRIAGVPALLWLGAAALGTGLLGSNSYKELTVTCLDVGQGDGALLQIPDGITCLIDGGSTSESSVWEYRISQTIKYYGISTIDYVFLSHADSDHISGIQEYLEDYLPGFAGKNAHGITLKNLVLPPTADEEDFAELIRLAGMNGITVLRMEAGAVIQNTSTGAGSIISGTGKKQDVSWSLSCLAPSSDHLSGDKNEDSMVLMLQYGAFRMLFTGDLENDAERVLAASDEDLSCDIMKVGHHGSNGASSEQFLSAVNPTFGVISCGENNSYGHPGAEAVERLQEAKVTLYTTMDCGALIIHSDGSRFSIYGYRDTSAYPEES